MIINGTEVHIPFDYAVAIAKHGGGVEHSRIRLYQFFQNNTSLKDRTQKVYDEYHNGGFGRASCERRKPFLLQEIFCFNAKDIQCEYTDGLSVVHEVKVKYSEVAKAIDKLIAKGKYLTDKDLKDMGGSNE